MEILLVLCMLSWGSFLFLYLLERRSLLISLLALNALFFTGLFVLSTGIFEKSEIARILIFGLAIPLLLALFSGPFVFLVALYYNGFQLLKREGFRLTNVLSLGLAIAVTLYWFVFPFVLQSLSSNNLFNLIFVYIGALISYLFGVSLLYTLSSFINFVNLFPKKLEYVVVLGAGLNKDKVTPLLASRIDKGIAVYKKHSGSKLILSGGQGHDELISEAQAMANYAQEQGVVAEDILLENQSANTEQNLKFSVALMKQNSRFAIVTNYYHLYRALLLARKLKLKCIGYGAKTKFYFSLNVFIREFVGYLVMSRKIHLWLLGSFTLICLLGLLIQFLF
ncbi:YdcF family protein [Streptococcus oriscaviae]|uniref:YdcF family protein n=1 Tax=Streptococcus oriscaviae TaxID=2781599 RepID=A0ABX7YLB9_9STRE|nr:YdcF family protein [Streptococcus oriscaviae]QUE54641.1 YdcF family protein [Streptococcus oriscaviae]